MLMNCLQIKFLFVLLSNQTEIFIHLNERVYLSIFEKDSILENKFTSFNSFIIGNQTRNQPLEIPLTCLNIRIHRVSFFESANHFLNRHTLFKVIFSSVSEHVIFAKLALSAFIVSTIAYVHSLSLF